MKLITLANLAGEEAKVDLYGHEYRVLGITRSVQKRLEEVQPLLDDIEKVEDSDSVVSTLASAIDAMLAPLDDAPSANECLNTAWRDDRLSLTQLGSLLEQVQETSVSRPT